MTGLNSDCIIGISRNDEYYLDIEYRVPKNQFISIFEDFRILYHNISKKYGILISYSDRLTELNKKIDFSSCPTSIYSSMFNSDNLKKGGPCYLFEKQNELKLNKIYYSDKYIIQTKYMGYKMRFILEGYDFFPSYKRSGYTEVIDNSYLYYLNTTRYNSYFRELKRMFESLGVTDYLFDSATHEISKTESINNKEELLKIGGEVIYYEDIYELLSPEEKYRPFEEIELM